MRTIIRYMVFVAAGIWLAGCKKELNVFPTTSEVDGNVIVDLKSASTVLNGVYYRFGNSGTDFNGLPSTLWIAVNETVPSQLCGTLDYVGGSELGSFTLDPLTLDGDQIWNFGFKLVNAANGFLKNMAPVNNIAVATKRQMMAEALFLRAYGNASLLLYYGQYHDPASKYGIIIRDQPVDAHNIAVARNDVASSYASILRDLDSAIAGLPDRNTKIYYANVWAAKLLKARLLINRGAEGDYAQVISLTKDVIDHGGFQLEANTKDIFLSKGFDSKEVILGVQPFPSQTYKFYLFLYYSYYYVTDPMVALLADDPRSAWMDKVSDTYFGGLNAMTKYFAGDVEDPTPTLLNENGYAFRLTEAYLLEAEAITLSGGDLAVAKSLLKTVEGHAGITDFTDVDDASTADELQLLVVKEELKNFLAENGADWLAMRRLPFSTLQTLRPEISSADQLILPIPYSEITYNKNILQNPGY